MARSDRDNLISCRQVQLLISAYMIDDPALTPTQREAFEAHLAACATCRREYHRDRELIALIKAHWGATTVAPKRRAPQGAGGGRGGNADHRYVARWIHAAATAAVILVAVTIGWMLLDNGGDTPVGVGTRCAEPPIARAASASADLMLATGRRELPLGRPLKASGRPWEIMLGRKHRVVMNTDAVAAFNATGVKGEGSSSDNQLAYEIRLVAGEIYVEVIPGHPFTVRTDNAHLDITGTKFNVFAGSDRTQVTLLAGSVRFSQAADDRQWVQVPAGHTSSVIGSFEPSEPRAVDALAVTAWARDLVLAGALDRAGAGDDLLGAAPYAWIHSAPPRCDLLDYRTWRSEHRNWFAREFPWIFKVQGALRARHGIDADYIKLLMVSGDIFQFNFPRMRDEPIATFDPAAIGRIARHWQVEPATLMAVVGSPWRGLSDAEFQSPKIGSRFHSKAESHLAALKAWRAAVSGDDSSMDLLLFNLRAGTYLANTRTAAYLWSRNHPREVKSTLGQSRVAPCAAEGLANQIAAANAVVKAAQELFVAPKGVGCDLQADALGVELRRQIGAFLAEVERQQPSEMQR